MKIGVIGAGALGLTFAARLAAVHDVLVLARRSETAEHIVRDGIAVESDDGVEFVRTGASADPHALRDRDAVIVAVKAHSTRDALEPLRGVLAPRALVASIQNGIDNVATAREVLPEVRIVAGSTTQGAIRLGEANVHPVNRGSTIFARDESAYPTTDDLVTAFTAAGLDARVADDVDQLLWRKLIVNAAINPLGALTGATNGQVVADSNLVVLAQVLAIEAATVAAAEGVQVWEPWEAVEAAARETASNRNSMLQDLDAGRPTEIDAISGAIVRRAGAHGLAVPLTETVLRLVRARERFAR